MLNRHNEQTLWDSIIVVDKERRTRLQKVYCADGPVKVADKEVEEAIVSIILENFPSHAVFGEETKRNSNDIIINDTKLPHLFRVVDPIDVTYSFNLEKVQVWNPYCSSLQGVAYSWHYDQPVTKDRWMGVTGSISTKNGEPLLATACQDLVHACVHVKSRHYSDEVGFACDGIVRSITIMQRHYLALAKEKRSVLQVLVHSDPGDSMRPHRRTSVVFNPRSAVFGPPLEAVGSAGAAGGGRRAGGRLQKMKKSAAPALPCVSCWLTGEDGAAAAGGENRPREM
uniref:Uncharacterized protein n=1 Tax=Populus alba TaxID=43335 RepID=A0A4U5NML0_POPAL|nr:hypothetical protein D5086_0000253860 [Populus alba]